MSTETPRHRRAAASRIPRLAVAAGGSRRTIGVLPLAALALAAVTLACAGEPEPAFEPVVDLVAAFETAEKEVPTRVIDFGDPAGRTFLTSGWSPDRFDERRGETYVRSTGWRSAVRFNVLAPQQDLRLRFLCRPLRAGAPEGIELTVELNGEPLTTLEIEPKLTRHKLRLPADRLVRGVNRLAFGYRQLATGSAAGRRPVIHWYRLELGDAQTQPAAPSVDAASGVVLIPYGTEITYLLHLPAGSRLRVERLRFLGAAAGRLELHLTSDEHGTVEVARITPTPDFPEVVLNPEGRQAAKLTLRATADGPLAAEDGVVLRSPRIWSSAPGPLAARRRAAPERPNVIVYLVDTLRADHLGCYGYPRPTSPRIDEFAAGATLFENAVGQSSWTRASVASLFTGLWPAAHGTVGRRDRLAPEAVTLAEAMQEAGYATAAVITNFNVHGSFGFRQGFETYVQTNQVKSSSEIVNAHALAWLEQRDDTKPFFLYLHTVDPHDPYLPPERFRQRFAPGSDALVERIRTWRREEPWDPDESLSQDLMNLYDGLVAYNDESFGALADRLRELDLWDDSLVILLSDHGEEFYEHKRWTHGKGLHVETLNFPLIVKAPGQDRGQRRSEIVQHTDVMPTVLELIGIDVSAVVQGTSFLPLLDIDQPVVDQDKGIYSHLQLDGPLQLSLVTPDWKLIQRRRGQQVVHNLLYRWPQDPGELHDLAPSKPVTTAVLAALLDDKLRNPDFRLDGGEAELEPEVEKQLRALGYLQ